MGQPNRGLSPGIQVLRPWHKSMALYVVAGHTRPGQLAQLMGMSDGQISRILASPCFIAEVERLQGQAEEQALDLRRDFELLTGRSLELIDTALNRMPLTSEEIQRQEDMALKVIQTYGFGAAKAPSGSKNLTQVNVNIGGMQTDELQSVVLDLVDQS